MFLPLHGLQVNSGSAPSNETEKCILLDLVHGLKTNAIDKRYIVANKATVSLKIHDMFVVGLYSDRFLVLILTWKVKVVRS